MGVGCRPERSPHDLGNISAYIWVNRPTRGLYPYGWQITSIRHFWKDLEWIREFWDGPMVIKGISIQKMPAMRYVSALTVSWCRRRRRQLDGVNYSFRPRPAPIADAVKGDSIAILADSRIRNGLDVVRMIALGAITIVLLGRAYLSTLATAGSGVANLLDLIEKDESRHDPDRREIRA